MFTIDNKAIKEIKKENSVVVVQSMEGSCGG
jgi:hypothetical protein